jgi:hypothetical protein
MWADFVGSEWQSELGNRWTVVDQDGEWVYVQRRGDICRYRWHVTQLWVAEIWPGE